MNKIIKNNKQILIMIPPPDEISVPIVRLTDRLSKKYHNSYPYFLDIKYKTHLMLYLSPMPQENLERIIDVTKKISENIIPFEIKLSGFVVGSGGYVFVGIDGESQRKINPVREDLVRNLKSLRDNQMKEKYLEKWGTFAEEEKTRIQETGLPYPYQPHITLGCFPPDEIESVMEEIKPRSFSGESFTASQIVIAQEGNSRAESFVDLASLLFTKVPEHQANPFPER